MAKTKKKQESGGARMARAGRQPMLLGLTAGEREVIEQAAKNERRPMTQFVLYHALMAAKKNLENLQE